MKQHMGSTEPFPAGVYEFARREHLGVPTSEYRWGFGCLEVLLMPLVGGYLLLGILVLLPVTVKLIASNTFPYNITSSIGTIIVLVPSFWYFIECFRRRSSWRVYVFTDGFAYFKGSKREAFRWEEISDIKEHVTMNQYGRPLFYYYRVERTDGYRVTLNYHLTGVRGVRNLGRTIIQRQRTSMQIDPARLSEELKRYHAGAVFDFGAIQISHQGVGFQDRLLPWAQVKEIVRLSYGSVNIRSKAESPLSGALIPAQSVRNVPLLMALVGEILKHPEQA